MTKVLISDADCLRLRILLEHAVYGSSRDRENWGALAEEVENAQVVPAAQMPTDVVTMHSRVRILDVRTGEQRVFRLVYPHEANFAENKISVLAPIGTALLGYAAGAEIEWKVPSGSRRLRVEAVEQPTEVERRQAVA